LTLEAWLNPSVITGVQPLVEWNDGRATSSQRGPNRFGVRGFIHRYQRLADAPRDLPLRAGHSGHLVWHHVALTSTRPPGRQPSMSMARSLRRRTPRLPTGDSGSAVSRQSPKRDECRGYYVGLLDELALYDRALTPAELQAIVAAGSTGKCVPPTPLPVSPPAGIVGWWRGESNTWTAWIPITGSLFPRSPTRMVFQGRPSGSTPATYAYRPRAI